MQLIDINAEKGCKVITFPDGEKHLIVDEIDRKDEVEIKCRIASSNDLFVLMQLSDILNRQAVCVKRIDIPYLMSMRCDRLFSINQPFTLKIVADVINSFNAESVTICEAHSNRAIQLIKNSTSVTFPSKSDEDVYCFPDMGAAKRYHNQYDNPIICEKTRSAVTGKLSGFNIVSLGSYKRGMSIRVLDDLCDGGSTFIGIAELLKALDPSKLVLEVTHAVNYSGIIKVSEVYDKVYITNSYKDWTDLPNNVIIRNL